MRHGPRVLALAVAALVRMVLVLCIAAPLMTVSCSHWTYSPIYSGKGIVKIDRVDKLGSLLATSRPRGPRPVWKLDEPTIQSPMTFVGLEQFEASGKYLL